MRRTVLAGVGVGVVALALAAAGCASKPETSGADAGQAVTTSGSGIPSSPVKTKNDCSEFTSQLKSSGYANVRPSAGRLPDSAHPVALLECRENIQDVPGQGQWQVVNTVRSTGPVDAFVSALRAAYVRPAEPTPQGGHVSCAAIGYTEQWLVLIDADGTAYRVAIPFWGICSAPDRNVMTALTAVKTTIASSERIHQTTSPGAQASGCAQQFAEMAFVGAQMSPPHTDRPFFSGTPTAKSFRACYYKLGDNPDRQKPAGDFESAATIADAPGAAVYDGLMNAPIATAAKTCNAPATEYAVLSGSPGSGIGSWSVVELDGCRLAAPDYGADRQVPAPVMQALLAAKGH